MVRERERERERERNLNVGTGHIGDAVLHRLPRRPGDPSHLLNAFRLLRNQRSTPPIPAPPPRRSVAPALVQGLMPVEGLELRLQG